jgi:hypothetical protein
MDLDHILDEYEARGFVRLRGFFTPFDIGRIRAAIDRYVREVVPGLPEEDRVFEADGIAIRNLWRMQNHDGFFAELAGKAEITGLVARLVRGRPVLVAVESFCKPAVVGSAVPYHQDNAYFCQVPPDVLTLWVALDAADETNGAVCYLPGSHRTGLRPHQASGVSGNSIGLAELPERTADEFRADLLPGDIVIHHSETIHRSGPNRSPRPRRGLLLVYRGDHTRTDPGLAAAYAAARAQLPAARSS